MNPQLGCIPFSSIECSANNQNPVQPEPNDFSQNNQPTLFGITLSPLDRLNYGELCTYDKHRPMHSSHLRNRIALPPLNLLRPSISFVVLKMVGWQPYPERSSVRSTKPSAPDSYSCEALASTVCPGTGWRAGGYVEPRGKFSFDLSPAGTRTLQIQPFHPTAPSRADQRFCCCFCTLTVFRLSSRGP